ncbi:helix-turn-helix transcriptional regulator [Clostridium senegalense]|uniref:helix-turn-helix domain-containing protein n=1 Tax=Clostridium senegalense TaxID=1465809 RepID=UPI001C1153F7|nr:helix-turn-helix transcriptional regulator [Clostridium senegalense]MBU5227808.1 helix-turn-helix transcriptional regulator [Clostridium senegalense]
MNLKKMCEEKGIDFKILSAKSGISLTYIYELQRGAKNNPSVQVVKKLASALGVDTNRLLDTA